MLDKERNLWEQAATDSKSDMIYWLLGSVADLSKRISELESKNG